MGASSSFSRPSTQTSASSAQPAASTADQEANMAVPEVDQEMLRKLDQMGFPTARATRALYYSGNCTIEAAINWLVEHENDADIDQLPMVTVNINIENGKPLLTPEDVKTKAQELRERVRKKKEGEEKRLEGEREKQRIQAGKELLEAKKIQEENERKRMLAWRQAEKEEERRAREKIHQKLEEDKAERRRMLGLPPEGPKAVKAKKPPLQRLLPVKPATKAEHMRDCLRTLKKNHKDEDARVKRAFQTLLIYVGNVAKNPDEEKFRRIRLGNPNFQDRVGSLKGVGGIQFLELCGFEKLAGDEYLYLPRDKVDMLVLKTAGLELNSAITNPFFGAF